MIKIFFLCKRRSDLSREEYARRVLEEHAPLALQHHSTLRRYEINIALGDGSDGSGDAGYDSLPALGWNTIADYRERLYDSTESQRIIERDTQRFMGGADAYLVTEQVELAPARDTPAGERSPGIKWILALRRRTDATPNEFRQHWREHAALLRRLRPGACGYVRNTVDERLSPGGIEWDGFAELWFSSEADSGPDGFASEAARDELRESARGFVGLSVLYPVAEYVQRSPGSGRTA